jgi:hypothetical protein
MMWPKRIALSHRVFALVLLYKRFPLLFVTRICAVLQAATAS